MLELLQVPFKIWVLHQTIVTINFLSYNIILYTFYIKYIISVYLIKYIIIIFSEVWPSIKCHIHTFILILFIDDIGFNSKAVVSMTLDNIAATLDENQVNTF